jgi:diadenosine tetraphosphate (Ap4A) HIT family hydrolase
MTDCFFCGLCAGKEADRVVYDDGIVSVVTPLRKDCELHLMVCPIGHVNDTRDLGVEEAPLLRHMQNVAEHCVTFARKRQAAGNTLSVGAGDKVPPLVLEGARGKHNFVTLCLCVLVCEMQTPGAVLYTIAGVSGNVPHLGLLCADIDGSTLTFHTAPLFNSLDHLHLHILDGQWRDWYQKFRHTTWPMSVYVDDSIEYVTSEEDTTELSAYRNHYLQTFFPKDEILAQSRSKVPS